MNNIIESAMSPIVEDLIKSQIKHNTDLVSMVRDSIGDNGWVSVAIDGEVYTIRSKKAGESDYIILNKKSDNWSVASINNPSDRFRCSAEHEWDYRYNEKSLNHFFDVLDKEQKDCLLIMKVYSAYLDKKIAA